MKYIVKHPAPQAFENWKKQENPITWDDFPSNLPQNQEDGIVYYSKNELRERLLDEQGYICCYCQQEIKNDFNTVVEHLKPRKVFSNWRRDPW